MCANNTATRPNAIARLKRHLITSEANTAGLQFIRYTFVGGIAFAVDFATLYALTHFCGLHYLYSAAAGFVVGLTVNYILSILWVFPRRSLQNKWLEFVLFATIGVVGLGINEVVMWFVTEKIGLHYTISKINAAVLTYLWNFIARKLALFSK
jgi:putative flippase GtrA